MTLRRGLSLWRLGIASLLLSLGFASWSQPDPSALQEERAALRDQILAVEQRIREQESGRQRASDQLRDVESRISRGQRELLSIENELAALRGQLTQLQEQVQLAQAELELSQNQIAEVARQSYAHGSLNPWQLLLSGERPEHLLRELGYLGYVAQERAALVQRASEQQQNVAGLQREAEERLASIEQARAQSIERREALESERARRQTQLAELNQALTQERRQAQTLREDEARMNQLLAEITAARERARREQAAAEARRQAEQRAQQARARPGASSEPVAPPAAATRSEPNVNTGPNAQRAPASVRPTAPTAAIDTRTNPRAALPVRGEVTQRFGVARRGSSGTTKGVFYRAASSEPVRAVADGTVVFSEWLRGFGNLIIVDHGGEILTVYGNNEALLREVGDRVERGEVIAATGNTGGQPETGLYFEVRQRGQPIDPLRWLQQRR